MLERLRESAGKVVGYKASGRLHDGDYRVMEGELSALIREHGRIRLVVVLEGFAGWEAPSAWEDFRFGMENNCAFERVAVVGESRWQAFLSSVAKPFIRGAFKYFKQAEIVEAWEWARDERP